MDKWIEKRPLKIVAGAIRQSEYERVLELVQKIRFGSKELKEYELYTLRCFERKMEGSLYSHKRFTGKIFLRYVYLLG